MTFTNNQLIGMGVAAVVVAWYLKNKAVETVKDVGNAVNPVNPDNAINGWFDSAYQAVTGPNRTLGGDIADWSTALDRKYYDYTPLGVYDNLSEWWAQRFSEVDG